jgi:hypothetical protein
MTQDENKKEAEMDIILSEIDKTGISLIEDEKLRNFVIETLERYGDAIKFDEAEEVIDVMLAMLTKMKQTNREHMPVWVGVMIAAAYIHNLFYDGTLSSLFEAREKLTPIAQKNEVPINAASMIFQAVEGQLGEDMPVESCQPRGDSPNRIFAWACWFVEEYNGYKILPECREL